MVINNYSRRFVNVVAPCVFAVASLFTPSQADAIDDFKGRILDTDIEMELDAGIDIEKNIRGLAENGPIPEYSIFRDKRTENGVFTIDQDNGRNRMNTEADEVFNKVADGTINSYDKLLEEVSGYPEGQKMKFLGALGDVLGEKGYSFDSLYDPVVSQEKFFYGIERMTSGENVDMGVCIQLNSYISNLAEDLGLNSAVLSSVDETGTAHALTIVETDKSITLLDYGNRMVINTENLEDAFRAYSDHTGRTSLEHLFFEDGDFKYRMITREGKEYLDLIGHDPTTRTLENMLVSKDTVTESSDDEGYINTIRLASDGLFAQFGDSRIQNMEGDLIRFGYERDGAIGPFMVSGKGALLAVMREGGNNNLYGLDWGISAHTDTDGLNAGSRISGQYLGNETELDQVPFSRVLISPLDVEAGVSYSHSGDILDISPYVAAQWSSSNRADNRQEMGLSESSVGMRLGNDIFSIDGSYRSRPGEHELSINGSIDAGDLDINAGVNINRPNYRFAPNWNSLSAGIGSSDWSLTYEGTSEGIHSFDFDMNL